MSGRQARFEIVRTGAGWHGRFRAANGAIVWTTESYERRRGALKAIEVILFCCSDGTYDEIRDADERPKPPPPPTIEFPIYHSMDFRGRDYWHDSDMHYRNCYGDECNEVIPPKGTEVQVRFGRAKFSGEVTR